MKTRIGIVALMAVISSAAVAQSQYDVIRFMDNELNGTARFAGMGGAMGALGADLSTMSTNPAGIGMYRSNDVALTFGFNANHSNADLGGIVSKEKRTKASFDQIGFVWSNKIGNKTNLRYVNFGFNYRKRANFNRQFSSAGGFSDGASLSWQMADMLWQAEDGVGHYYNTLGDFNDLLDAGFKGSKLGDPYTDSYFYGTPYLSSMGARTGLLDPLLAEGSLLDDPEAKLIGFLPWNSDGHQYYSREEGGVEEYDFNLSFNVQDRYYFGVTVGAYSLNYNRYSSYGENIVDGEAKGNFTLNNWYKQEGTGFDVKLGAIIRPFEYSPFRIGFSIHTPIWYSVTEYHTATLTAGATSFPEGAQYTENLSDYLNPEYVWDYRLTTPWRFGVSMGTIVSGMMALDAEYEYAKYSSAHLEDVDGYELNGTTAVNESLKGVHTFRVGMETKLTSAFSMRAGYNFQSSPIHEDSFKNIPFTDETRTDAEYLNLKSRQAVTFGMGYRGRLFYADVAYKYDFYKANFYAFGSSDIELPATKVNNERHQVLFTLGVHF